MTSSRESRMDAMTLTPEQLAAANALRHPSHQLRNSPECGSRLTSQANRVDRGLEKCTHPAGYGTDHVGIGYCKFHGGNTKAGRKAAARMTAELIVASKRFGGDFRGVKITPEQALLEEVRRSVAMVRWLEDRIGSWDHDDSDEGLGGLPSLVSETSRGAAQDTDQAAWLLVYREERAHMARVAKMAIDSGIAARLVEIAEDQGRVLASAIRRILDELSLSPDQASLVPKIVPGVIRSITDSNPLPILSGDEPDIPPSVEARLPEKDRRAARARRVKIPALGDS